MSKIERYRPKKFALKAIQYNGSNGHEIAEFLSDGDKRIATFSLEGPCAHLYDILPGMIAIDELRIKNGEVLPITKIIIRSSGTSFVWHLTFCKGDYFIVYNDGTLNLKSEPDFNREFEKIGQ
jgi:hypothetical protein